MDWTQYLEHICFDGDALAAAASLGLGDLHVSGDRALAEGIRQRAEEATQ